MTPRISALSRDSSRGPESFIFILSDSADRGVFLLSLNFWRRLLEKVESPRFEQRSLKTTEKADSAPAALSE
jgi:hypothetical protein